MHVLHGYTLVCTQNIVCITVEYSSPLYVGKHNLLYLW